MTFTANFCPATCYFVGFVLLYLQEKGAKGFIELLRTTWLKIKKGKEKKNIDKTSP